MTRRWSLWAVALSTLASGGCGDGETRGEVSACENGSLDAGEENVDCGGACPACQSEVDQYGIRFTFDQGYRVGQFANGDTWVLGPTTLTGISPDFDGTGRYPDLHGQHANEPLDGGYTSAFISAMWAAYHPG